MKALNSTFGVTFYLRRYKINQDGTIPIYMRITVNGKRLDISVKRTLSDKNWNAGKGMAKGSRDEVVKLNNFLERLRSSVVECYQELHLQKKLISVEIIKEKVMGDDQKDFTLCKLIEYHNREQVGILAVGTLKNYYTTERYLRKFLIEHYKTPDKYLTELTYSFIMNFEHFLRNHTPLDHHRPLNNNGIMKHIERFRKTISLAVTLEWMEKDPFTKYKQKFDPVERQCLNIEELKRIEQKDFEIERLQQVKDLFVFSCYTGLSYIDVMNLKPDMISVGLDGKDWIVTSRQKTLTRVRIPILEKARTIIEKYKTHPKIVAEGGLLPKLSNQRLNGYLKEIADLCGITKPLTFHIARHTFATTITLNNGVPMESVSKMLGHTKLSTTQVYAKVIEQKLSDDMFNLSAKLLAVDMQN